MVNRTQIHHCIGGLNGRNNKWLVFMDTNVNYLHANYLYNTVAIQIRTSNTRKIV